MQGEAQITRLREAQKLQRQQELQLMSLLATAQGGGPAASTAASAGASIAATAGVSAASSSDASSTTGVPAAGGSAGGERSRSSSFAGSALHGAGAASASAGLAVSTDAAGGGAASAGAAPPLLSRGDSDRSMLPPLASASTTADLVEFSAKRSAQNDQQLARERQRVAVLERRVMSLEKAASDAAAQKMRAEEVAAVRGRDLEAAKKEVEAQKARVEQIKKDQVTHYEPKFRELMEKAAACDKEASETRAAMERMRAEGARIMEALRREAQVAKEEAAATKSAYIEANDERDALKQLRTFNLDAMTSLGRRLESVMAEKGEMEAALKDLRKRYATIEREKAEIQDKVKQLSLVLADMTARITATNEARAAAGSHGGPAPSAGMPPRPATGSSSAPSRASEATALSPITRDLVVAEAVGVGFRAAERRASLGPGGVGATTALAADSRAHGSAADDEPATPGRTPGGSRSSSPIRAMGSFGATGAGRSSSARSSAAADSLGTPGHSGVDDAHHPGSRAPGSPEGSDDTHASSTRPSRMSTIAGALSAAVGVPPTTAAVPTSTRGPMGRGQPILPPSQPNAAGSAGGGGPRASSSWLGGLLGGR